MVGFVYRLIELDYYDEVKGLLVEYEEFWLKEVKMVYLRM